MSPFVHPGHEVTIVLNEEQVRASGGFSTAVEGNRVEIRMRSLFGADLPLPERRVSADSPAVLRVPFPDCSEELGRTIAGPVEIRVWRNEQLVAHISHEDLVVVPPSTDVTELVLGEVSRQVVTGSVDAHGDLWVPVAFRGDHMPMPGCEGDFIHPVNVRIGAALATGEDDADREPFAKITGVEGYLGDMWIGGHNYYGYLFAEDVRLVHVAGTLGISICQLNDAIQVVLRVRGNHSLALQKSSPFYDHCRDSRPLELTIFRERERPGNGSDALLADSAPADSFSNQCSPSLRQIRKAERLQASPRGDE